MKNGLSSEFMFQLFALLTAIILVHAMYVAVIRPSAEPRSRRIWPRRGR
jgi:hypothetical protein